MRNHLVVCIMSLLLGSCVSVQFPGGKSAPAKDVEYKAPAAPYKEITTSKADKTWLSSKTGNTISYLSECGNGSDPSLSQIENESLSALSNLEVVKSEALTYNSRAAHQTVAHGEVDGIPVQISLLVFKKNGCNYTLSYGGVKEQFASEQLSFEEFKRNFKAP